MKDVYSATWPCYFWHCKIWSLESPARKKISLCVRWGLWHSFRLLTEYTWTNHQILDRDPPYHGPESYIYIWSRLWDPSTFNIEGPKAPKGPWLKWILWVLEICKNPLVYRLLVETRRLTLMNGWPNDLYILRPVPLRTNKVLRQVFFQSRPCDVSVLISFPNYDHMVIRSCQVFCLHQTVDGVALCHCFGYNAAWFNSFVVDPVFPGHQLPGFTQNPQTLKKNRVTIIPPNGPKRSSSGNIVICPEYAPENGRLEPTGNWKKARTGNRKTFTNQTPILGLQKVPIPNLEENLSQDVWRI